MFRNLSYIAKNEGEISTDEFFRIFNNSVKKILFEASTLQEVVLESYKRINNLEVVDTNFQFAFDQYARYIYVEGPNKRAYGLATSPPTALGFFFPWLVKMGEADTLGTFFIRAIVDVGNRSYLKLNVRHNMKTNGAIVFMSESSNKFIVYEALPIETWIDKLAANIFLYFTFTPYKAPPPNIRLPRDDSKFGQTSSECAVPCLDEEFRQLAATQNFRDLRILEPLKRNLNIIFLHLIWYLQSIKIIQNNFNAFKSWRESTIVWLAETNSLFQNFRAPGVLDFINRETRRAIHCVDEMLKEWRVDTLCALDYLVTLCQFLLEMLKLASI